jgi:hypothetical protein
MRDRTARLVFLSPSDRHDRKRESLVANSGAYKGPPARARQKCRFFATISLRIREKPAPLRDGGVTGRRAGKRRAAAGVFSPFDPPNKKFRFRAGSQQQNGTALAFALSDSSPISDTCPSLPIRPRNPHI